MGLSLPPPYKRRPSLEFHTPPIEVCAIEDTVTNPSSPVPPPAPESHILFSNAENIPPGCCGNPPAPRARLQRIEEVISDVEDSDVVAERLGDKIGDEDALGFLNGSNESRGAHHRAVCAIAHCTAPYAHCMQAREHCPQ